MSNEHINHIVSQAHSLEKNATKRDAITDLHDVIMTLSDNPEIFEHKFLGLRLATIYRQLMTNIPATKSDTKWVSRAMAKGDSRPYLNYILINEKHMMASNGHRMHVIPNRDNLPTGFYDKNLKKISDDVTDYPKYQSLHNENMTDRLVVRSLKAKPYAGDEVALNVGEHWYNRKYFLQATNGLDVVEYRLTDGGMITLRCGHGNFASIMPVRV